jgi:hypothetical protein
MTPRDMLQALKERGGHVVIKDGRCWFRAPDEAVDREFRAMLSRHRRQIENELLDRLLTGVRNPMQEDSPYG